jgi:hypothetical protein
MKKWMLLLAILGLLTFLNAQKIVQTIDVSYDNPVVTRVVITLSDKAEWTYVLDKNAHQVKATIYNCDAGNPIISGLNKNFLVTNLDIKNSQSNAKVNLSVDGAFLIEKSTYDNPFRIVIDLFKYQKSYSYQDRLYIATFYTKVNKLEEADREYAKMAREFPQNLEVYYHWGQLLVLHGKIEDARDKFNAVPQGSSYFQAAQNSLAKLDGKAPLYPESQQTVNSALDTLAVSTAKDTTTVKAVKMGAFRNTFNFFNPKNYINLDKIQKAYAKVYYKITGLSIWFWIIIIVVVAIVILVVFDVIRFRKQSIEKTRPRNIKADNATKQNMVNKLLVDGWKEPEIARELMMSEKEAKLYIKQGKKLESKRNKN